MRKIIHWAVSVILFLPYSVHAQTVPAIQTNGINAKEAGKPYTAVSNLSEDTVQLNGKEQRAVRLADQWKDRPDPTTLDEHGAILFEYGNSLPSVVCAPLYACDVSLETGEIVSQVDVGDAPRWKITPATSGSGDSAMTHLIIKPADLGLVSNMIVNTNRRTYHIRLVSKKTDWMPSVSFTYPQDAQEAWQAYQIAHAQPKAIQRPVLPPASALNFNYRLTGDSPHWRPVRVYADQNKTYIQFPPEAKNREIPALVLLGPGNQDQLVNYRLIGDRYVVDSVIDHAALITGVGRHQERVTIQREGL